MKLGIIGYGGMGAYHCTRISEGNHKSLTQLKIKGVFDIDEKRNETARKQGLYVYSSMEEMLSDEEIGGVLIATPNDTHAPIAKAAAEYGKHILSEKPIACSPEEAKRMYEVAEKNGVTLCVDQNRRFDRDYLTMREIVKSGEVGKVYRVESIVSGGNGIPGAWRKEKARGGGMMLDWGVHLLDQMYMLYGKPERIICRASYVLNEEVDDGFSFLAEYQDGTEYLISVETNCFVPRTRWTLLGEEGTAHILDWSVNGEVIRVKERHDDGLHAIHAGNGLTKTMATRREETLERVPLPEVFADYFAIYNNFLDVMKGGEPITRKEEVLAVMNLMAAAMRSSTEKKYITI
ncbi:MAG: Gfo/Idh/MocA family oxidoreductase [Christensenellaceae bacterium]